MIVIMDRTASLATINSVLRFVEDSGCTPHVSKGDEKTIIGVVGDDRALLSEKMQTMPGVEKVIQTAKPYRLVSREWKPENTVIDVNDIKIGGGDLTVIAGPCGVESETQLLEIAHAVKEAGASILRGGAFKPRTSPYSFQGLGERGLELLAKAREATGLAVITEVVTPNQVPLVSQYADILQIGARNSQNYSLLQEIGKLRKPVMLKRGMMSNLEEYLMAAEYILANGNYNVILCERGIRTFETSTRNTMDISAIPLLKSLSHLPMFADPSHATGKRSLVAPVAKAAVAAGADGLMIEVHNHPEKALSDGIQALLPESFAELMKDLKKLGLALNRQV
ncbi:MAG: 3-deoxy-7-phosphoheptulonate synthase [Bacteroidetes bacterium]|nr:3-deoxy-7-phosphoheptulonate synthase [Bacteroidota bacterium]